MRLGSIPIYELNEVSEITLLSIEEWEKAKEIDSVPKITSWWWLRSPGYFSNEAYLVSYDGNVNDDGFTYYTFNGVRPAFKIQKLKSEIGSKIFVENTVCTVIDKDYALSDTVICQHRFDAESNDFEKSEIKEFINSDEFKKLL